MDVVSRVLGHPLTLLLLGAALSGLLVPRVTRGWQDQRKALEVKVALAERLTRAVVEIATSVQFALVRAEAQSQVGFDQAYRTWQLEKSVLTSLLSAYLRDGAVTAAWIHCRALATAYYVQAGIPAGPRREQYLGAVAAGLSKTPPLDVSEGLPPLDGSDGTRDARTDDARGQVLADPWVLRAELDRALTQCVSAVLDARISLVSSRR
jgi:hypothetical protein